MLLKAPSIFRTATMENSDPSTSNWEFFKIARNKVHTITKRQNAFIIKLRFWKNLRKIGIKKKSNECNFDPQTMTNLFSNPNTEFYLFSIEAGLNIRWQQVKFILFLGYNSILSI